MFSLLPTTVFAGWGGNRVSWMYDAELPSNYHFKGNVINDTDKSCTISFESRDGEFLGTQVVPPRAPTENDYPRLGDGVTDIGVNLWYVKDFNKDAGTVTLIPCIPVTVSFSATNISSDDVLRILSGTTVGSVLDQLVIECDGFLNAEDEATFQKAVKEEINNGFRFGIKAGSTTYYSRTDTLDAGNYDFSSDYNAYFVGVFPGYANLIKYEIEEKDGNLDIQVYDTNDELTAGLVEDIAKRFSIDRPDPDATQLILPSPDGCTIEIEYSGNENVLKKDGTIIPPEEYERFPVIFRVSKGGASALTPEKDIGIPARSSNADTDSTIPSSTPTELPEYTPPSVNLDPPISSSSGSSGGSSSSNKSNKSERRRSTEDSGSGSVVYSAPATTTTRPATTATPQTLGPDTAESAVSKAIQSAAPDAQVVRVNFKNVTTLTPETLQAVADVAAKAGVDTIVTVDTMRDEKRVFARIYVDAEEGAKLSQDINVAVKPASENLQAQFEKYFSNANMAVMDFGQKGSFGMEVQVAAKIDVEGWDTATLYFYIYDMETNSYRRITNPDYWIDSNGYLHFTTDEGNYIIITDEPLQLK